MNTYEYIKERNRMCKSYDEGCEGCPALDDLSCAVGNESTMDVAEQIAIVEKWSAEHPKKKKKTRQDVFLKQYPEAQLDKYGVLDVCPSYVSADYRDKNGECFLLYTECRDCRATFWMAEVKEDK